MINEVFGLHFTTSAIVDDISGRGIGMGAIKQYVEQLNGICLLEICELSSNRQFAQVKVVLELSRAHFISQKPSYLQSA